MISFSSLPGDFNPDKTFTITRELKADSSLKHDLYSWLSQFNSTPGEIVKEGELFRNPPKEFRDLESEIFSEDCIIDAEDDKGTIYHINVTQGNMLKIMPDSEGKVLSAEFYEKISFSPIIREPDNKTLVMDTASILVSRKIPFINEKGDEISGFDNNIMPRL